MYNSKQLATLSTDGTGRRQRKQNILHRKLKIWATPTPAKNPGVIPGAHDE